VSYRAGADMPGDHIAYLQVGVPTYRISQMVKNGANVLDAYGYVNVVSPCGLPMRGIVGIAPDPMMFIALNCQDIATSKAFYTQLGFVEQVRDDCVTFNHLFVLLFLQRFYILITSHFPRITRSAIPILSTEQGCRPI
jgi:hypothetical protein